LDLTIIGKLLTEPLKLGIRDFLRSEAAAATEEGAKAVGGKGVQAGAAELGKAADAGEKAAQEAARAAELAGKPKPRAEVPAEAPRVSITPRKLQHEFKHAPDFGITGNWNKANGTLFEQALKDHVAKAPHRIKGTYRRTIPVTHYFDPATNLWVAVDEAGEIVAAWRLSAEQLLSLLKRGNVQ
jgi:hypothetical protein